MGLEFFMDVFLDSKNIIMLMAIDMELQEYLIIMEIILVTYGIVTLKVIIIRNIIRKWSHG